MAEILEEIMKRRSGRAFSKRPIPEDTLESILEAGRWAPSCNNTQAWNYVVIKSPEMLQRAHQTLSRGNAYGMAAPVMIIVAAKEDGGCSSHGLPYFMMDVGLTTQNILLQAVHMGLLAHPTAGWDEDKLKEITGIPTEYRIGTVIFIGYEGDINSLDERSQERERAPRQRKALSDIVHFDKW